MIAYYKLYRTHIAKIDGLVHLVLVQKNIIWSGAPNNTWPRAPNRVNRKLDFYTYFQPCQDEEGRCICCLHEGGGCCACKTGEHECFTCTCNDEGLHLCVGSELACPACAPCISGTLRTWKFFRLPVFYAGKYENDVARSIGFFLLGVVLSFAFFR